jgi:hypothetical protein
VLPVDMSAEANLLSVILPVVLAKRAGRPS